MSIARRRSDACLTHEARTAWVSPLVVAEFKRIIETSEIIKEDDSKWPQKNIVGKQELEIKLGNDHISFQVRLAPLRQRLRKDADLRTINVTDGQDWLVGRRPVV